MNHIREEDIPRIASTSTVFFDFAAFSVVGAISLKTRDVGQKLFKLPGGDPHPGEHPRATAIRETREESGIIIPDTKEDMIPIWVRRIDGRYQKVVPYFHHVYFVSGVRGPVTLRTTGIAGECAPPEERRVNEIIRGRGSMPLSHRIAVARAMLFLLTTPLGNMRSFGPHARALQSHAERLIRHYDEQAEIRTTRQTG